MMLVEQKDAEPMVMPAPTPVAEAIEGRYWDVMEHVKQGDKILCTESGIDHIWTVGKEYVAKEDGIVPDNKGFNPPRWWPGHGFSFKLIREEVKVAAPTSKTYTAYLEELIEDELVSEGSVVVATADMIDITEGKPYTIERRKRYIDHGGLVLGIFDDVGDFVIDSDKCFTVVVEEAPVEAPVEPLTDDLREWAAKGMEDQLNDLNDAKRDLDKAILFHTEDSSGVIVWDSMNDDLKGSLLLARHKGEDLQYWSPGRESWVDEDPDDEFYGHLAYRKVPQVLVDLRGQYQELTDKIADLNRQLHNLAPAPTGGTAWFH